MPEDGDAAGAGRRPPLTPEQLTALTAALFEGHLGVEFSEIGADRVCASLTIRPELCQGTGVTHGGVYCAMAESVASMGASVALNGKGYAVGVNNNTDFLRATRDGVLTAEGIPVFRGRQQQLWRVVITGSDGRECAQAHVRLQNVMVDPAEAVRMGRPLA
ncbi:PaaI family thioesterase [uncultured Corynebacterium sp.]|uniref:PaaI family thioesterase n=1 Tax=uncultured Corynebacterium sp. TaxID=159447 RepID=UPI002591D85B|nr:PaaI family thioesterase [uncultured Corynebacterium sp.]